MNNSYFQHNIIFRYLNPTTFELMLLKALLPKDCYSVCNEIKYDIRNKTSQTRRQIVLLEDLQIDSTFNRVTYQKWAHGPKGMLYKYTDLSFKGFILKVRERLSKDFKDPVVIQEIKKRRDIIQHEKKSLQ